jgi:hypothetical protein
LLQLRELLTLGWPISVARVGHCCQIFFQAGNRQVEGMLGRGGASGVAISVQNILLGDGSEISFDRLNLDPTSKAKLAFPHGNSKGEEHVFNDAGREANAVVILWVEVTVRRPCGPVAVTSSVIHCCSSNCLPRNVSKTLDFSQIGTITSCQV